MRQFKFFVLLFLLLIVQGTIFPYFVPSGNHSGIQLVPEFLLATLLMAAQFGYFSWGIRYSIIFGLLTDIVFTPVVGVYAFSMTLSVYLTFQLSRWVNINVVTALLLNCFGVLIEQLFVYLIYRSIDLTGQSFLFLLSAHLLPTLLLNAVFSLFAYYPLHRFLESMADQP